MAVIGDVAGQGARAAALTALARHTIRAAGRLTGDPLVALQQLNGTLREQPELSLVTVACPLLRRKGDEQAMTAVSGGHPLPVVVRDGEPVECGQPGALAGAFDDVRWTPASMTLHQGDVVVLYTDGVIDTVGEGGARFGDERLTAALRGAPADPAALVDHVGRALRAFQRGRQRDDTAILALGLDDARAALAGMPAGDRPAVPGA